MRSTTPTGTTVTFQPDQPLAAEHDLHGRRPGRARRQRRLDGSTPPPLQVKTVVAPAIVRFRPLNGTTSVLPLGQAVGAVHPADESDGHRAGLRAAIAGKVDRRQVDLGREATRSWSSPRPRPLPKGAIVTMAVSTAAAVGVRRGLAKAGSVSFKTSAPIVAASRKAKPPEVAKAQAPSPAQAKPGSGGGTAGAGAWHAVEVYYLGLMNCTRGGGWVLASGKCSSPGGSGIKPLILNAGISNKVSRPYAKFLAQKNICSHFAEGNPGRSAPSGRLSRRLPREHRLPQREQPLCLGPGHPPLLPGREALLELLPLGQHHGSPDDRGRDRDLGDRGSGPAGRRLLEALTAPANDHACRAACPMQHPGTPGQPAVVLRNVVIHLNNEQPVAGRPVRDSRRPRDMAVLCTNLRTPDGKRPVFIDQTDSTFLMPLAHIRFIEIPEGAERQ